MTDHVEVLRVMRDFYAGSVLDHKEKADALTAAISAMTVADRLSAAHAAELAERDARIAYRDNIIAGHAADTREYQKQIQQSEARAEAAERRIAELETHAADRESEIETIKFERQKAEDEAEAAERDARRYRWLRECHSYGPVAVLAAAQNHKLLEGPFLDAAIDAFLAQQAQVGGEQENCNVR